MKFDERGYYTLKDFLNNVASGLMPGLIYGVETANAFKTVYETYTTLTADDVIKSDEVNTLFCQYLAPWNIDSVIYVGETSEAFSALHPDQYRTWFGLFCQRIRSTYEKYKPVVDFFKNQKANLMNRVKSASDSRFNDTPQNSGSYNDDDHASNVTHNTAETDGGTVMTRLAEIDSRWKNLYFDWAYEFRDLFYVK